MKCYWKTADGPSLILYWSWNYRLYLYRHKSQNIYYKHDNLNSIEFCLSTNPETVTVAIESLVSDLISFDCFGNAGSLWNSCFNISLAVIYCLTIECHLDEFPSNLANQCDNAFTAAAPQIYTFGSSEHFTVNPNENILIVDAHCQTWGFWFRLTLCGLLHFQRSWASRSPLNCSSHIIFISQIAPCQ